MGNVRYLVSRTGVEAKLDAEKACLEGAAGNLIKLATRLEAKFREMDARFASVEPALEKAETRTALDAAIRLAQDDLTKSIRQLTEAIETLSNCQIFLR